MQFPFSEKNALYLLTILEAIEKIKLYSNGYTTAVELFEAEDQKAYNGICHLLLAIGEESRKIEAPLKETQSFISWEEISGLRNRIAHDYRGIDRDIVFQIVKNELGVLREVCLQLFVNLHLPNSAVRRLLEAPFYKHLKYLSDHFESE
jgi:uncharacterized protein with HEPN domain